MKNRKAKAAAAIISGLVITAIIITGAFFMFGKNRNHTVTDCSSLTLRLSGMRITEEYEITCDGKSPRLTITILHIRTARRSGARQHRSVPCR
jgi:hypothetical protein